MSWNLNGLDPAGIDTRTEAAVAWTMLGHALDAVLAGATPAPPPDVICFQEVTERTLAAHIRPALSHSGYRLVHEPDPNRTGFEIIAAKTVSDWFFVPLADSAFRRSLLVAHTPSLTVVTGHFDSGTDRGEARLAQAHQALRLIADEPAVFVGDTNLRDGEARRIDTDAIELFTAAGEPDDHRWTWFAGRRRARFDRGWCTGLSVKSFRTLGRPGFPSDHLGLDVRLTLPG